MEPCVRVYRARWLNSNFPSHGPRRLRHEKASNASKTSNYDGSKLRDNFGSICPNCTAPDGNGPDGKGTTASADSPRGSPYFGVERQFHQGAECGSVRVYEVQGD